MRAISCEDDDDGEVDEKCSKAAGCNEYAKYQGEILQRAQKEDFDSRFTFRPSALPPALCRFYARSGFGEHNTQLSGVAQPFP